MDVPEVDIAAFAALLPTGVAVIDVREPLEYKQGHVAGARLIPMAELVERFDEVPEDETVYLICAVGGRSARAAQFLLGEGLDAVNVAGGTKAWIDAGHPTVTGDEPV